MAENTAIEWTDHTFNPWWGCTKISPGCTNCYADALDRRTGGTHWGPKADRRLVKDWSGPPRWDKRAAAEDRRCRVFCASMADAFDDHPSILPEWRDRLWSLIEETPHLDWLLLTKRPDNIMQMVPDRWRQRLPDHVWLGCSVVDQHEADTKIPVLLQVPARVRFLSMEPLLGPVDIGRWLPTCYECGLSCGLRLSGRPKEERCTVCGEECGSETDPVFSEGCPKCGGELEPVCPDCGHYMVHQHPDTPFVDWIIVGGESGPKARAMNPDWVRSIRDQCKAAGVPFFMKQMGGVRKPFAAIPADLDIKQWPEKQ